MSKRVVFTGGTGKAGRHAVAYLAAHGFELLNVDLAPLDQPNVKTLIADVTDGGQVFNALSSHFGMDELKTSHGPRPVDAVVHFAAIPRILIKPDDETFRVNVLGTYNVIEAATKLGIRKIVIASSETTYGVCFELLPLDLAANLNIQPDRAAVACRRRLKRLGVTFGTTRGRQRAGHALESSQGGEQWQQGRRALRRSRRGSSSPRWRWRWRVWKAWRRKTATRRG